MKHAIAPLCLPIALLACVVEADDVETEEQAINGPSQPATAWMLKNAVDLGCTGTLIGSRHVLSAAHCIDNAPPGSMVRVFVSSSTSSLDGLTRTVDRWFQPPGVTCPEDYTLCHDAEGDLADLAIFSLTMPVRTAGATLAWSYPGIDEFGWKVGVGSHEGEPNDDRELLRVGDTTWSDTDEDKDFNTTHCRYDYGDSGGPFYHRYRVLATAVGCRTLAGAMRGRHVSVPAYLPWILDTIDYTWSGTTPQSNVRRLGAPIEAFVHTEHVCQYACDETSACEGYNHIVLPGNLPYCQLLTDVTGVQAASGFRSASKD